VPGLLVRRDNSTAQPFDFREYHPATGQHDDAIEEPPAAERNSFLASSTGRLDPAA
jgi:hypothetical protein